MPETKTKSKERTHGRAIPGKGPFLKFEENILEMLRDEARRKEEYQFAMRNFD